MSIENRPLQEALDTTQFDFIILPGNPYGLTVSGLDATVEQIFGPEMHEGIRNFIAEAYAGMF